MTQKKNILIHDFGLPTKKKYLSPSIRLCKALSMEVVMQASSVGGEIGEKNPVTGGGDPELSKSRYYAPDFYSGYDNDY